MNSFLSPLGLDGTDLESSVNNLLRDPDRTEAVLSLTGDAARQFMDVLLKVSFGSASDVDQALSHNAIDCR
jgi:hypothetical protein